MSRRSNYSTRDIEMTKFTLFATALLSFAVLSIGIAGCSKAEAPRASADSITEVQLNDVPKSVKTLVLAERQGFKMEEVLKKVRDGRVYYDVEGELPSGDEIEFDVLMTDSGPEIVEIQRDILWRQVPRKARGVVKAANTDGLKVARVIESTQTDGSIIYELLTSRWKH